jgi:hypothetical protein
MSATATTTACIGEPISWLRLEQFALSRADTTVSAHVEKCDACRACLGEIERDVVALPPLTVPATKPARRFWSRFVLPAGLAIAAAAILLLVVRPRRAQESHEPNITQVKGLGTVELGVVRERAGVVRQDVRTFASGDRWKVVVTCAANEPAWVDVLVYEAGVLHPDYPLDPVRITCGNGIAIPGAFAITGDKTNTVCVRVSTDGPPQRRDLSEHDHDNACVALSPE